MADFYFGETGSPDYGGNWNTYGGASPGEDKNQSSIYTGGTFTTTASAIVITELSRGAEDSSSNAGGTVSIGVIDITSGTTGAPLLGSATLNFTAAGTNNYIWHTVTGLSIAVPQGRTIAIVSGKPTVSVWHTQHNTLQSEFQTPSTTSLPANWTATGSNARAIPLRAGYSLSAPTQIDDINGNEQVRAGSTGNTITTTGLGTLTTLTLGGKSATSISATGGDGTFSMPAFVDATTYSLLGTVTATAGDGTTTTDLSVSLLPMTGWSYVTLSGTLNTTNTGVLYNFSPAASVGDQIVYETAKGTVDAQGNYEGDFDGTQTMWHIKASDGVTRSYDVITGEVGVTFNITGLSTTMNQGAVAGTSGGVIKAITGLSMTASRGTISAISGGVRHFITGLQSSTFLGNITSPNMPPSLKTDYLPKFLVESVSKLRKTFRKSFRKK